MSLLAAWGVPVIRHALAASSEEARHAGAQLGYPVVLKTAEPGILHKSDVSGVRLGLANETELLDAYRDLAQRLGPRVLLALMARQGVELAIGMVRDPVEAFLLYGAAGNAALPNAHENQRLIFERDLDSHQRQQVLDLANEGVTLARLMPGAR